MKFKKFERQADRRIKRNQPFYQTKRVIGELLRGAGKQLVQAGEPTLGEKPGSPEPLVFTKKAVAKLKTLGLSEADCIDVVRHGSVIKEHMLARKYNGYEIGVVYGINDRTGQTIIFSAWKRER
jgi:hypothetical protein